MLKTFLIYESDLIPITEYLDHQWQWPGVRDQYIWSVQRSLFDDRIILIVECDDRTECWIRLSVQEWQ